MKDIDHIIHSYQGLDRPDLGIKRDTWAILNGNDDRIPPRNTLNLNREALDLLRKMPSKSTCGHREQELEYPAFRRERPGGQRSPCSHSGPIRRIHSPQGQEPESVHDQLWDTRSVGSSVYSNGVPGSLYRHAPDQMGSEEEYSPHTSFTSEELPSSVPNSIRKVPSFALDTHMPPPPPPPKDFPPVNRSARPRTAPSAAPQYSLTAPQPRSAGASNRRGTSIRSKKGKLQLGHTRVHLLPDPERSSPSSPKAAKSGIAKIAALFTRSSSYSKSVGAAQPTTRAIALNTHLAVRMAQSSSKSTTPLPFCKGAWAIRDPSSDPRRSLTLQSLPDGLYNAHRVWQCKECRFRGGVVVVSPLNEIARAAEPELATKKKTKRRRGKTEKEEPGIDNEVYTSAEGIRYRWIFLAKSHVRKKSLSLDSPVPKPPSLSHGSHKQPISTYSCQVSVPSSHANGNGNANANANFGCILCSAEGRGSGVYGNVETLMGHIFLEHAREMGERARLEAKCVMGRLAGKEEEWDLNIPF